MSRTIWLWAAASVLLIGSISRGEGLPVAAASATAQQIADLIDQLDRSEFAERQAASLQLEEAGFAAVSQLELAATTGSREASGRAFDILKRHFQQGSDDIKLAAREVLERLAQSDSPSTAQRARDVLNPPKQHSMTSPNVPPPPPMIGPRGNFGGGFGFNGNFGPGGAPIGGAIRRISISDINGRKVLDVDELERRVRIETAPGGGITVEVTNKQNRLNETRRFEAKDLDELKRRDAELGRLYEQYHGGQRQLAAGAPAGPFGIAPPPATISSEIIQQQLQTIETLVERYKQRLPTDPAAQRVLDSLEETKQRYKAMLPAQDATRVR